MKKIAVITTSKELKEFQERTDIRILDINVKACDQTWATQEYFVATIVYDDDLNSDPDYWTRLEHQYAGMAMQGICSSDIIMEKINRINTEGDKFGLLIAELSANLAHALVEKMKEERK
jgi:Ni2+-binding GTPase involved in maturation of urease and hydrogenase